jgi:hypothetical protein
MSQQPSLNAQLSGHHTTHVPNANEITFVGQQWQSITPIHMICALRSQCAGLGAVWPLKPHRSAGLFKCSAGLFLLTFFTFCYFFTACNFCKLLFNCWRFTVCYFLLLFFTAYDFINYFLLLRGARGIVVLYLFIVQGEGVRLDFFLGLV